MNEEEYHAGREVILKCYIAQLRGFPEEGLWAGIYSTVLFSSATFTLVGGSLIVAYREEKFLRRKLYESDDSNVVALYKVVKQLDKKGSIGW